jgi:hypothetical protein
MVGNRPKKPGQATVQRLDSFIDFDLAAIDLFLALDVLCSAGILVCAVRNPGERRDESAGVRSSPGSDFEWRVRVLPLIALHQERQTPFRRRFRPGGAASGITPFAWPATDSQVSQFQLVLSHTRLVPEEFFRHSASRARARDSRDITVPRGTPVISAISW